MMRSSYVCPVCRKSVLTDEQETILKSQIQHQIDLTNMGEIGNKDVKILCNECGEKSDTKFHIVAYK